MARWRGTVEWRVFVAGWILLAVLVAQVVAIYLIDRDVGWALLRGIGVDMVAGREGAAGVAIHYKAPPLLVAETSALQHLATGAIMFPVFLSLLSHYHDRDNFFMRRLRRLEAAAAKHQAFVSRWGPVGVFLFMLVPFLVNGPLVGAIVGRLCGIRTKLLILPVVGATIVSALIWTYANERLQHYAAQMGEHFPLYMVIAVIALALLIGLIDEMRERRENRAKAAALAQGLAAPPPKEAGGGARIAAGLAAAVLLLALAWPALQAGPGSGGDGPAFEAFHFDSAPDGPGYRETWCVTRAPAGWATQDMSATLDGAPAPLDWEPAGTVGVHSRFTLVAPERDIPQALVLSHNGTEAWRTEFGAGAGTPIGCGR